MEAVVQPEPVWLLEDQAVLDDMKREEEMITFPDIKDEFLRTDIQNLKHKIIQNDPGIKEEAAISDDRNEDVKTEIDLGEHSILKESSEFHGEEMDAVVKPEPVWLLEDQAMICVAAGKYEERRGGDILPSCSDEFVKTDMQVLRHSTFQTDAGIKEEAPISDDGVEDMKTEIVVEEHSILEERSESVPNHKRSGNTGAQECGEININTDKPDCTVTEPVKCHNGDKLFKCEVCSKCFTQRSHLTAHISIHTGYKPYKCEVCSKCYTLRSSLYDHIKTHTADNQFKCEVCSKCFTQRSRLTDHVWTHIGDKPFKCKVCSKSFTRRGHLSRHVVRSHTRH